MKQILLLTDFSENSINAIHYALNLFKEDNCNFYVLHVESSKSYLSDDLVMGGGQSIYDSIVKKSKNRLLELIENLKSKFHNPKFTFQEVIDFDGLTQAINQVKTSKHIDLIVMGSNGVTGAKEIVFGSNTINVIRNVYCPTLIVPEGFSYIKPLEVLLPLDLDDTLNSNAFSELLKFTEKFSDKLHLLRMIPSDEASQELENDAEYISAFIKGLDYAYHVIEEVPMDYTVSCYTQTHPITLTALLVQKERFVDRFFTSSSTSKISNKLRVPLLVFHS
jgi:nucleotide-binding universal stress UspA family protein